MYDSRVYDEKFYTVNDSDRFRSANAVLSEFFKYYRPESVVDLGCGVGHWLQVCTELGVGLTQGYDGNFVDFDALKIPQSSFSRHDFEQRLITGRRYDLAISIEVAEHLPKEKAATFVESIVSAADVVVFSAAAPYQGGVNHFNEQPPSYWAKLFNDLGYVCFDFLRDALWENAKVNCVHAQNVLVFAKANKRTIFESKGCASERNPRLKYHPEFVKIRLGESTKKRKKKGIGQYFSLPFAVLNSRKNSASKQ